MYDIIPYKILKTTISNCPKGLPFALNISDVTPISDAMSVIKFSLSKRQNDKIISNVNVSVAPRNFGLIYFVAVFKVEEGKENEIIETE